MYFVGVKEVYERTSKKWEKESLPEVIARTITISAMEDKQACEKSELSENLAVTPSKLKDLFHFR